MISLPAAKMVAQVAATLGVSKIAGDVIKNHVTVLTRFDAFRVWTGTVVLSSLIAEQSSNHIERVVDSVSEAWNKNRKDDRPDLKEVS